MGNGALYMEDEDNGIMGGLCMECYHAEGPYWSDICFVYNMPFTMVHRKNKCKHFRQAVY